MKKVLITLSAFAVALMVTVSSHAACSCNQNPVHTGYSCPCQKQACPCNGHSQDYYAKSNCCEPKNSCNTNVVNEKNTACKNSWEVIKHSHKLSQFKKIVKKAEMQEALECGNYIVFAPTNCALKGLKFDCKDKAKHFVLGHLADCKCYPDALCAYTSIKTLCGKECPVCKEGNTMVVCKSTVIVDNVKTKNGRVYALDRRL